MPLLFLTTGQCGVVVDILGGRCVWEKLAGIGLAKGVKVSMVKNDGIGPMIVGLGAGRLVLGRGISRKVIVEEVKENIK